MMRHEYAIACAAVEHHEALQRVDELAELLVLLGTLAPLHILEIGSYKGGALWAFRAICPDARIVSVDSNHTTYLRDDHRKLGAHLIEGDSHDPAIKDMVISAFGGGQIDFLFIDADHSYEAVRQDCEDYSPLVTPGGLVAFHDIEPNPNPGFGVDRLWREIRAQGHSTIEIVARDLSHGRVECGIGVVRMP